MESVEIQANKAFLNGMLDGFGEDTAFGGNGVFATDGDFISEGAMNNALKNGNGLLIGGFFVGAINNDFNYGYSL